MVKRPIYYDTETTGIKQGSDKIIELAAYDPFLDKTFEQLIDPERPIPEEASRIHHITDDMVQGKPTFGQIAPEFIDFCSGDTVLIAHNNDAFDKPFLEFEFQQANVQIPEWSYIDSLKWARKYRRDLPRHALQYLREVYEIEENQAHRALDDVKVLHSIFSKMVDDLSFETILKLLSQKIKLTRMPFGKHVGKQLKDVPKDYVSWLHKNGALDKKDNEELQQEFKKLGYLEEVL